MVVPARHSCATRDPLHVGLINKLNQRGVAGEDKAPPGQKEHTTHTGSREGAAGVGRPNYK